MGKLIYSAIASLDGFIEDEHGKFDWAAPDEEVHAFVNDLERPIGIYLYGRRMYETMAVWETYASLAAGSDVTRDYAEVWRATDKIVYSTTLDKAATSKTRIVRTFEPEAVRMLKTRAETDLAIGGATLAAGAFGAGLIDECRLFLVPVLVGAGKRALPAETRLDLELLEERRFGNGTVYLRYRTSSAADTLR